MAKVYTVYFVGAGPGDPELITVKGRRLLGEADVVVYAGSLVNAALLEGLRAELHDSSKMDLDGIIHVISKAVEEGKKVVRLHSGDLSFYSAITEQVRRLRELGIEAEAVPGVSSLAAGAAILRQELTPPELSQTVIVTRMAGRTPVPEREGISNLAAHGATMVIFLSIGMIKAVMEELKKGGYPEDTPVVVVEKASWPEERAIRGTIGNIAGKVEAAGIERTALIYVGDALRDFTREPQASSKLYDRDFSHGCRK
jgi:precorrin-4/cobalt-precorrin-4 C11-methyltransferase